MSSAKRQSLNPNSVLGILARNEEGDASIFKKYFQGRRSFDLGSEKWFRFGNHHWIEDRSRQSLRDLDEVVAVYTEAAAALREAAERAQKSGETDKSEGLFKRAERLSGRAFALGGIRRRENVLKLAAAGDESLGVAGEVWDSRPDLLALTNGTLELGDCEVTFRAGRADDYLRTTTATPWPDDVHGIFDAEALNAMLEKHRPTRWLRFLKEVLPGSGVDGEGASIFDYMHRLLGYTLGGQPVEHVFPILWGPGRNGKTLLVEVMAAVLGDMAAPVQSELLLRQSFSRSSSAPSPELLTLHGKRLAWASEAGSDSWFDPARLKWLSGGDTITGRALYSNQMIRFRPSHQLFLITNHRPHVDPDDLAFWRRVHLISFDKIFVPKPDGANEQLADPHLRKKLLNEAPGILVWLVRGWLAYKAQGLNPPAEILAATEEYRTEEDVVGRFLAEVCEIGEGYQIRAGELQLAFKAWVAEGGGQPLSANKVAERLGRRFEKDMSGRHRVYRGLRLKPDGPERHLRAVTIEDGEA